MRIGVDATCWQNNRGYGRHARALLSALVRQYPGNHYEFFLDWAENLDQVPGGVQVRLLRPAVPTALAASANGHRAISDMWRTGRALSAADLDLVLFPTIYSYVPVLTRARKLIFIHDVIAETFPRLTLPRRSARILWNAKVALGRWQADAVVTVSEYSRRALLGRFEIDPKRVVVVGEAADPVFRPLEEPVLNPELLAQGVDPRCRMIVYVGGFSPHKNLLELVSSYAAVAGRTAFADTQLVMVGEYRKEVFHSYYHDLRDLAERLGVAGRVVFPGYVPDKQLVGLLNLATVLVLPSLMEGFGLPAVEAAACGCPVIATTASPLPDLLGDGGLYIEPGRGELTPALETVLNSERLRSRMRQAGLAAARKLTWDAAANQLIDVIRGVS
jgi:glycosyltransferase involved in cell wall biosynthesis